MRTPEETKKKLESYAAYYKDGRNWGREVLGTGEIMADALAYIQQLERERDAAVEYLSGDCDYCKHRAEKWLPDFKMNDFCLECCTHDYCNWQWRGVQEVE